VQEQPSTFIKYFINNANAKAVLHYEILIYLVPFICFGANSFTGWLKNEDYKTHDCSIGKISLVCNTYLFLQLLPITNYLSIKYFDYLIKVITETRL
jgi:hypothetical protein